MKDNDSAAVKDQKTKKRFQVTAASLQNYIEGSKFVNWLRKISESDEDNNMLRIKLDLSTLESDDSQSPAMRPPASPNYDRSARRLRTTPRTPKTPKTPKGDRSPLFFTPETFWPNTAFFTLFFLLHFDTNFSSMSRQYGYHDLPSSHLNFPFGMPQVFMPTRDDQSSNGGYQVLNGFQRQDDYFPSSSREHQERVPSAAPPAQFNSPAHNFTQHLRERSPSSSSALLNLLQRYPSARQSVYSGRIYPAEEVPVDRQVFRPADASTGYPLVEVAVPKQTAAEIQRPYPGPPDQHLPSFSNGYSTFSNRNGGPEYFSNYSQGEGYGQTFPRGSFEKSPRNFEQELYQFPRSNYNDPDVGSHLSQRNNWPAALDIDSLLGVAEDTMNKSTAEWKRSFAQVQERFQQSPGPPDNFSPGFPGRPMLTKSSSHKEIHDRSLLGHAVERAQEAPEFQRSGSLNGFWSATVDRRPFSPSIQRLPTTLTAAERLQLLQEPIEKSLSYTPAPAVPQRLGSRTALAARREKYLQEANSPPSTPKEVGVSQPLSPRSVPNFSDLDSAVQELQNGVRQTGYSLGARHLGGCGRFPTDYNNLSPPRLVSRKYTPSPTETISESSSAYQVPNGLPHPKPKHNIKEQMYQASVQTNFMPRSGLRPSPNFPVPSTGSVASRITEFEKRPGTPTLHIANNHQIPFESGPMSPGNAVFRSKPTIHVDIGPSYHRPSQQANTVFSFETPSTPKDDSINRLTERLGALSIQTPGKQRETSQPKPTFDLNLSGSDASNCSNDSSYGFNNLSVNKALRGLLHNEQDLVASPILPRKPKIPPPSFYFPQGKPVSQAENTAALRRGLEVFRTIPGNVINYENMDQLCQAVGIPVYWKKPMFSSILYPKLSGAITITEFSAFWTAMTTVAHDEAARFVYILTGGKATEIKREHLRPLIHDVILTHPGLAFYRTSVEFHDKYCDVVITRVFWNHRRTWALHITAEDLRRGDFLESVRQLELEEDINKNLRYFSYEHFYVVYCLFWEIDQDHDLKIRPDDLARHQRGAITRRVVERIFSRAVSKHPHYKTKEIGLVEFTQFLLADEDKQHPSSIDYWFRIMDEDGDGVISLYDMETYFGGIQEKLSEEGIDCMKFSDVACHLIDAIQPKKQNSFRRADFMNNKLSPKFFNSFVNFRKFYYQETTEGSEPRLEDASGQELTDWDRFCVEEYEALMDQSEADNVDSYDLYLEDDEETRAGSGTYNELL